MLIDIPTANAERDTAWDVVKNLCSSLSFFDFDIELKTNAEIFKAHAERERGTLEGFSPAKGPPTLGSWSPFSAIFAALNLAVIDTVMDHVNVHVDYQLLRVAVPSQWRTNTCG